MMAWNPSPEVAVARDAAKALGDADQCIVLYINYRDEVIGAVTFGKTKALCAQAKRYGDVAYEAVYAAMEEQMEAEGKG